MFSILTVANIYIKTELARTDTIYFLCFIAQTSTNWFDYIKIMSTFVRHITKRSKQMKTNESKYKLVVNYVIENIKERKYKKGDWIPSINEFRKMYNLSRDTVFAGISELKTRGIINSTPGVGYYVASLRIPTQNNIFSAFQ